MPRKLVAGVGTNDADYPIEYIDSCSGENMRVVCQFYIKWHSMICRCYNEGYLKKRPSYEQCIVCDEWLIFSNFRRWMENEKWEGRELDKDLKFCGNCLYSPDTCLFLPREVNGFLIKPVRGTKTSGFPMGVIKTARNLTKKWGAQIWMDGKQKQFRWFLTAEEAHKKWQQIKIEQAYKLAYKYREEEFSKYLINYAEQIEKDVILGQQTHFKRRM